MLTPEVIETHEWSRSMVEGFAKSSQTVLSLASGGVALLITVLRDTTASVSHFGMAVALGCFVASILAWMGFSTSTNSFLSLLSFPTIPNLSEQQLKDLASRRKMALENAEALMRKWMIAQRAFFSVGALTSSISAVMPLVGFLSH